jgi:6-pyruvoyltetrahydropterin/6-carboxytetrahydropterin synthase
VWDHAFLVYQHDLEVLNFLNTLANHKTVIFPTVPTAENMANEAFKILKSKYQDTYGTHLKLEKVRLYETPNNWADALT